MKSTTRQSFTAMREHAVTPNELRRTLGRFATGVAVLATNGSEGGPVGITASSLNSLSLEPPLILFSLGLNSARLNAFETAEAFAVNLLAARQRPVSERFAQRQSSWQDVEWREHWSGAPVLARAAATLICRPWSRQIAGDHVLFIGEVIDTLTPEPALEPLIHFNGGYRALAPAAA